MTSLNLVQRAIHFGRPERLPYTGSMGETDFSGDTVALFPDVGFKYWLGEGGTDEWGCRWEIMPGSMDMGQVKNAVLKDIEDFARLKIPDAGDPKRYAGWPTVLDRAEKEGKYVVVCNGSFIFERTHFLYGFENLLMDIIARPDAVQRFMRHIAEYHFKTISYIERNFAGRIHGYRGTDDWGTQTTSLIAPERFMTVFQPVYADIFGRIHHAGMDAWMHSCGQILNILPLLIEAGLDVVNLMQPNVFPIPRLAQFKGRVCFEVSADVQGSLPAGDKEAAAREIQALLDNCCTENGGIIEMMLDRMFFDGCHVPQEMGPFCRMQYRSRDPFPAMPE